MKSNFFGLNKKSDDEVKEEAKSRRPKTSAAKWTDHALRVPTNRELDRIRERDIDRQTKKHRRRQKQSARQVARHNEVVAVKVLAAYEQQLGLETGGVLQGLVENGLLSAHQGYRPATILDAAGLDQAAIQGIHEMVSAS